MSSTVRGAIDPLLGYLSSAIRDEAQLLGGVRRDAQFIKDEMESMNGFLHHLAVADKDHEGDHEVRAWMKQVRDLTYDTQYCVDLYGRRVGAAPRARGVRGHAHRAIFFLRTIPARHRVGKQMKELMSRARDVGERRQRYGVQVPAKVANEISGGDAAMDEELHDLRRRLVDAEPLKDATVGLINWLWLHKDGHAQEPKETVHGDTMFCSLKKCVRFLVPPVFSLAIGCQVPKIPSTILVIAIVSPDEADGGELAKEVYNHSSVASLFECKAFVTIQRPLFLQGVLRDMIRQLRRPTGGAGEEEEEEEQQLEDREELQKHVKGRRLLVVVENPDHPSPWNEMKEILDSSGCSPGSAIMVTTKDSVMAECFSPNETVTHSFVQYCFKKANRMVFVKWENRDIIRRVLEKCDPDLLCMKLLLGTLYADSYTSEKQLEDLCKSLEYSSALPDTYSTATSRRQHIMTKFCYDKLPMMDRCCLLYMSIFAKNSDVTRQSLERRWVSEGQVIQGDGREAMDRAQRCFDGLVARGFLAISKAGKLGNVIYCKVHPFVHDFITKVRKEDNFGNKSLPSNLAPHLSISSDIQWHQVSHQKQHGSGNSCNCFSPVVEGQGQGAADDITTFIESLPTFSRVARVKVMDLDCCEHLKNQHLKIICNNLFLLKYLSIRSTRISRLPREIKKLQQLETFDIRQTSVPSSATRGLLLPMLKHLLAGPVTYRPDASPDMEISTVEMPSKIGEMTEMETLHYVEVVEDDKKLEHVKNLKRLRKLGVVIQGKQEDIDRLLRVVTELSLCLRELSVWIRPSRSREGPDDVVLNMEIQNKHSLYKLLEKLSIKGITKGLPTWIEDLSNLAEITLRETSLTDMGILGKLKGLRCLTLRHESYIGYDLILKTEEFENIKFLAIEGVSHIKRIVFEPGTAPKLEKIVWTFAKMNITKDTIIDLKNLLSLKELEFSGDFNPSHMQLVVAQHQNCPNFKYTLWRDVSVQE